MLKVPFVFENGLLKLAEVTDSFVVMFQLDFFYLLSAPLAIMIEENDNRNSGCLQA